MKLLFPNRCIHRMMPLFMLLLLPVSAGCRDHPGTGKVLIWSDEFDYEGLPDDTKWSYEEGFVRNNEPQYYTKGAAGNAFVKDGVLKITARKENGPDAEYTSASIHTGGKFEFTGGRIEVKAKLPRGKGVWPAIWTLGVNISRAGWPVCGEIDIMEYWGANPHSIHANVHTGDYNHTKGSGRGGQITFENPWEDFHLFAVEWYGDRLDFYFDKKLYYSCKKEGKGIGEWPFEAPQYLLINLALTSGEGNIDPSVFPAEYLIDYVRIYRFE
ncbi:MAG: glycoside hydrolase family 16 protein [Tannerella sp.]|jgi:beta-glucanase (GH16 family)|nr:glycoside hydrolase family 16 protein [Tannerella sp.]